MAASRTPLISAAALDPLSFALPIVGGAAAAGLCVLTDHPFAVTFCSLVLVVTLAWAALRQARKFGRGLLNPLVLGILGASLGLGVGSAIGGLYGPSHGPEPDGFRLAMAIFGAQVFVTVGIWTDFWWCEDWVPRETALRRAAWGVLAVTGTLLAVPIVVVVSA